MASPTAADLVSALRAGGMRVTRPRAVMCEVLADARHEHLTPQTLHERAEARLEGRIDPSTVYRTLEALTECGAVYHVHLGHGAAVIHLTDTDEHHHLVCEVCERTVDLPVDEVTRLTDHIGRRYGFVIDSMHFAMIGRCAEHDRNES
ncbi:MAG: Fur family transcriptional regulator [Acidimicrobiia bacterium]|nr:Fur family transcriptional regulator [Acidimicrobiia bacterium]